MRLRLRLLIAAAAVAVTALLAAPTAAAAGTGQTCTDVAGSDTECFSPGNVQINDAPQAVESPFIGGFYPGPYPVPWDEGGR
jgi:hypothetical protein